MGAGKWRIKIIPSTQYSSIKIEQRGKLVATQAKCISAGISRNVVESERVQLLKKLCWADESIVTEKVNAMGAGNIVSLKISYQHVTEVIESIGVAGVSAEKVADKAVKLLCDYQSSGAPVGDYLADQLLLPLVVASGGTFVTGALSEHCKTNLSSG